MELNAPCPCQAKKRYVDCCYPIHTHRAASNAESLMRSRYSAYVLGLEDYLLETWHPDTRPPSLDLKNETAIKWLGLEIKSSQLGDSRWATVEFVARYKVSGKAERLHEISRFECLPTSNKWVYVDGTFVDQ